MPPNAAQGNNDMKGNLRKILNITNSKIVFNCSEVEKILKGSLDSKPSPSVKKEGLNTGYFINFFLLYQTGERTTTKMSQLKILQTLFQIQKVFRGQRRLRCQILKF